MLSLSLSSSVSSTGELGRTTREERRRIVMLLETVESFCAGTVVVGCAARGLALGLLEQGGLVGDSTRGINAAISPFTSAD